MLSDPPSEGGTKRYEQGTHNTLPNTPASRHWLRSRVMSGEAWVAWGIAAAIALAALVVGILTWRKPKSPPSPPVPPKPLSDLRIERVGGIGSSTGAPRESVKAKLRLVNDGDGDAVKWQVVIRNNGLPGVKIGREPLWGARLFADEIEWHQDAATGEVPAHQYRDFPDWFYAEAPAGTEQLGFFYTIRADGIVTRESQALIRFGAHPEGVEVEFFRA